MCHPVLLIAYLSSSSHQVGGQCQLRLFQLVVQLSQDALLHFLTHQQQQQLAGEEAALDAAAGTYIDVTYVPAKSHAGHQETERADSKERNFGRKPKGPKELVSAERGNYFGSLVQPLRVC